MPVPAWSPGPNSLFSYRFYTWYQECSGQPAHIGRPRRTKTKLKTKSCQKQLFLDSGNGAKADSKLETFIQIKLLKPR